MQQYEAVGHAVRAMYMYSGMADVAVETHDPGLSERGQIALGQRGQQEVLRHRRHRQRRNFGGLRPQLLTAQQRLLRILLQLRRDLLPLEDESGLPRCQVCGHYEETMYNALLGATDLEGKNFYYANPLERSMGRSTWHACPCCVGNIPRTLLMMPTWVYAKAPDGVYVNMFIGSTITVENVAGTDVEMVQETDYPWSGKMAITVNPKAHQEFQRSPPRARPRRQQAVHARRPEANGIVSLPVNGKAVKPVDGEGLRGDHAQLEGRRQDRTGAADEGAARARPRSRSPSTRGKVALRYGPLIYNIEKVDQDITKPLAAELPLTAEWRGDLLGGVMVIKGKFADGSKLLAVPNYARTNRDKELPPEAGPLAADPSFYLGPTAQQPGSVQQQRRGPRQVASEVWMEQG